MERLQRQAARALLVDEFGACLLVHHHDFTVPDSPSYWVTPGGGLDPGESFEDGLRRELFEETGLQLTSVGAMVHERRIELTFFGQDWDQYERYFRIEVPHFEPVNDHWTPEERQAIQGWKWWTTQELRTTTQTIFPTNIVELLTAR